MANLDIDTSMSSLMSTARATHDRLQRIMLSPGLDITNGEWHGNREFPKVQFERIRTGVATYNEALPNMTPTEMQEFFAALDQMIKNYMTLVTLLFEDVDFVIELVMMRRRQGNSSG